MTRLLEITGHTQMFGLAIDPVDTRPAPLSHAFGEIDDRQDDQNEEENSADAISPMSCSTLPRQCDWSKRRWPPTPGSQPTMWNVRLAVKDTGLPAQMAVGDRYTVRTAGPWSGPVEVVDISDRSFRFATLDGHMEAGLRLAVRYLRSSADPMIFASKSTTRQRTIARSPAAAIDPRRWSKASDDPHRVH